MKSNPTAAAHMTVLTLAAAAANRARSTGTRDALAAAVSAPERAAVLVQLAVSSLSPREHAALACQEIGAPVSILGKGRYPNLRNLRAAIASSVQA